ALGACVTLGHAFQHGKEDDHIDDHHLFVEAALFREVAYPTENESIGGGVCAEERDRSLVSGDDVHDHAERGRLARAVGSKDAVNGPGRYGETQIAHSEMSLVALGDVFEI